LFTKSDAWVLGLPFLKNALDLNNFLQRLLFAYNVLYMTDRGENCIMMNFITCILRVIKSRRMKWAGHVARTGGGERCLQGFDWEARRYETTGKT
jgi:hypothetical protein